MAILTDHKARLASASFSPNGKYVITASGDGKAASGDGKARIWDSATGHAVVALSGHHGVVWAASFSQDGGRVVTSSSDHTAKIWEVATGRPVVTLVGHEGSVDTAAFSQDGNRVVTASRDGTARVWDARTGRPISVIAGLARLGMSAAFSPDGTRVVTNGSINEQTTHIWDADTGQPVVTLRGHLEGVSAAAFSPDGNRVVTSSFDHTARIAPATGDYLQSLFRARTIRCLGADFRHATLGEDVDTAGAREKACHACVPHFFSRIRGVPAGNWRTYLAAWRAYQDCLR
jgi:WD40 repeat protein